MLLSASLSWRCSGRRASGAFKSTGHVDSDIKAAVNSKQSREQTVELIITPEFIPDVFTVQTDSFVLSLPPWGETWKTFMKQLSLHKVKPDQGRVPADVSGGDECPGSCLSDVVSVSVSVSVVCFSAVSSQRLNWRITSPANWQFTYNLCCSKTKHFWASTKTLITF